MKPSSIHYKLKISPLLFAISCLLTSVACTNLGSDTKGVQSGPYTQTGRISMAKGERTQCGGKYEAESDTMNGHPIAGVDGATFGATVDGENGGGTMCGKCVKTSKGDVFAVEDRAWENDGQGGGHYTNKGAADSKSGRDKDGTNQIDISKSVYQSKYNDNIEVTIEETGC